MIACSITETKAFMNRLLLSDYFDAFFLSEADFVTFTTFHIDGTLQKGYYSSEELREQQMEHQTGVTWKQVRPFCLELIRGTHTPLEFKIVLRLSPANVEKLLRQNALPLTPEDIHGLFLNLHFQNGALTCITGASLAVFSLDKSLDHLWDATVRKFLKEFI